MFDPEILAAIRRDAEARYPLESCGVVTAEGYRPLPNVAADPAEGFDLGPEGEELLRAGAVLAVVHSHPDADDTPSVEDQRQQIACDVAWGLLSVWDGVAGDPWFWGEGRIPAQPLDGRDFRWGPAGTDGRGDCLALVRDWYRRERGLVLPDHPRDRNWLRDDPTLYWRGALGAGFTPANPLDPQPGDLLLLSVQGGGHANHAAVALGGGYVLHHMENRLAERASLNFWRQGVVAAMRPPARPAEGAAA